MYQSLINYVDIPFIQFNCLYNWVTHHDYSKYTYILQIRAVLLSVPSPRIHLVGWHQIYTVCSIYDLLGINKQRTARNDIVLLIVCRQKYSPLLHVSVHVMYKRTAYTEPFTMYWHQPTVLLTDWHPPTVLTGVRNVIVTGVNQDVFVCSVLIYVQRTRGFTTMRYINLRFTYSLTGDGWGEFHRIWGR